MTRLVNLICAVVLAGAVLWARIADLVRAGCRFAGDLMRPRFGQTTCRSSGRRLPAVREQLVDAAVELGGQAREHVFEVGPRVGLVELGRLQQAHDHCRAFAGELAADKKPVPSTYPPGTHLVFEMVVVCALLRHG